MALTDLANLDPREVSIVELRYFAGFSEDEMAEILDISWSTVSREWRAARRWLVVEMREGRSR